MDAALNYGELLQILSRHGVDFILAGGVAAVLEGAPVSTFDLDIVIRSTPENYGRLLAALGALHARYLDPAGRHITPDAEKLATMRLHRLLTDFGPLDVMTSIGNGLGFPELASETVVYQVAGCRVVTLKLETIIRSKEQAGRDKDRAALPILYRTLQLKKNLPPR